MEGQMDGHNVYGYGTVSKVMFRNLNVPKYICGTEFYIFIKFIS